MNTCTAKSLLQECRPKKGKLNAAYWQIAIKPIKATSEKTNERSRKNYNNKKLKRSTGSI